MAQALLHSAKTSLVLLKNRITTSKGDPCFELEVQLVNNKIALTPDLEEIQGCLNNGAFMVLKALQKLYDWDQDDVPEEKRKSFYNQVTSDFEIVRVVLLLNGSIQAAAVQSQAFLAAFEKNNWLWNDGMEESYAKFLEEEPTQIEYEEKFRFFTRVVEDLNTIPENTEAACVGLNIKKLKGQVAQLVNDWKLKSVSHFALPVFSNRITRLRVQTHTVSLFLPCLFRFLCVRWKHPSLSHTHSRTAHGPTRRALVPRVFLGPLFRYASKLHEAARFDMAELMDYIGAMDKKLNRPCKDLISLQYMMNNLREIREAESMHLVQMHKLVNIFTLLSRYLPEGVMTPEELDAQNVMETVYVKLSDHAEDCSQVVANMQGGFKRGLLKDVADFKVGLQTPLVSFLPCLPSWLGLVWPVFPSTHFARRALSLQGGHGALPRGLAGQGLPGERGALGGDRPPPPLPGGVQHSAPEAGAVHRGGDPLQTSGHGLSRARRVQQGAEPVRERLWALHRRYTHLWGP